VKRIQRSRAKGWRMPPNVVYVGRPSRWGNPFGGDRKESLRAYREWVLSGIEGRDCATGHLAAALDAQAGYPARTALVKGLPILRGYDLACWCPLDQPCHADVLLEIANA